MRILNHLDHKPISAYQMQNANKWLRLKTKTKAEHRNTGHLLVHFFLQQLKRQHPYNLKAIVSWQKKNQELLIFKFPILYFFTLIMAYKVIFRGTFVNLPPMFLRI